MNFIIEEDCRRIIHDLAHDLDRLKNQTLLVTGFSGFVGAYLTNLIVLANKTVLKEAPCTFIGLDNFARGKPSWVGEIARDSLVRILDHDISQPLPKEIEGAEINFILHAASIASPTHYRLHPIETMDANVTGLRNLLDYSLGHRESLKSFLFFSSSEVYGDPTPENIPTPETYRGNVSFIGPRACYDEAKRYGETLCVNFHRVHNVPIKTVRPFNNYGPGLKLGDRRVIPDLFKDVLAKRDIILLSDGKPMRTFCYIADAVLGYFKTLLSEFNGEAFNIGADKPEISILELAQRVIKVSADVLHIRVGLQFQKSEDAAYLSDNPQRRCPDISKARELLYYDPETPLEEGLKKTALWYHDNQSVDTR
jgi:dTDP-glucose 4,6-dehydratase/UDP-glucuronate decarboxylase